MKKAIITGATSFIGIALMNLLITENCEVTAVIRPDSARKNILPQNKLLTITECELKDLDTLDLGPCSEYDCLFHIGWSSDFKNGRYNLEGQKSNLAYNLKAVELAHNSGCQTFVSIGSQAECGRVHEAIGIYTPDHPENAYGIIKCRAAKATLDLCEKYGIKHCWPRLVSAYGPYERPTTLISQCLNACLMKQHMNMTKCEQIWDYIYVEDVAVALVLIAQNGKHGVKYPIGSGIGRKLCNYIQDIASLTGNQKLLDGIGKRMYSNDQVMHLVSDISDLTGDTGFHPSVSFKDGIMNTYKFLCNKNTV